MSARIKSARIMAAAVTIAAHAIIMPVHAQDAPAAAQLTVAKSAIKSAADNLRSELMSAMQAGGVLGAVGKCQTVAPEITRKVSSAEPGMWVKRTALRIRNPQNAPDGFERKVLEDFVTKMKAGADPATLEHVEEITQNGVTFIRYMKPITMAAEPCAACHGAAEKIDPAVAAEIKRLYPGDQATGFTPGELRGAFSVAARKP